jgi:hypothetical protein
MLVFEILENEGLFDASWFYQMLLEAGMLMFWESVKVFVMAGDGKLRFSLKLVTTNEKEG